MNPVPHVIYSHFNHFMWTIGKGGVRVDLGVLYCVKKYIKIL